MGIDIRVEMTHMRAYGLQQPTHEYRKRLAGVPRML